MDLREKNVPSRSALSLCSQSVDIQAHNVEDGPGVEDGPRVDVFHHI